MARENYQARQCWIAGYSFGAWIGLQLLMRRPDINNFIAVSPPANEKDFSFLAPCPTSGLIIQGGRDEIGNPASVATMARRLNTQKNVEVDFAEIEEGDHMYNNHLVDLYKVTGNYIIGAMSKKAPQKKRRGRRRKSELEEENSDTLLLEDDSSEMDDFADDDLSDDDSFDDDEIK